MPAGIFVFHGALVVTSDALQVANEAHASMDLAGALSEDPDRASPSSALDPTAPLTDPNTPSPEPILPAQAVVRVSATILAANVYMAYHCITYCLSQ